MENSALSLYLDARLGRRNCSPGRTLGLENISRVNEASLDASRQAEALMQPSVGIVGTVGTDEPAKTWARQSTSTAGDYLRERKRGLRKCSDATPIAVETLSLWHHRPLLLCSSAFARSAIRRRRDVEFR